MGMLSKNKRKEYHTILATYIDSQVQRFRDAVPDAPEAEYAKAGGIVKQRVAFYIHMKYDLSFHALVQYACPDKIHYKAMKEFSEANIDYEDIKKFFHENRNLYNDVVKTNRSSRVNDLILFDKEEKRYVRIVEGKVKYVQTKYNASSFGFCVSNSITTDTISKTVIAKYFPNQCISRFQFFTTGSDYKFISEYVE